PTRGPDPGGRPDARRRPRHPRHRAPHDRMTTTTDPHGRPGDPPATTSGPQPGNGAASGTRERLLQAARDVVARDGLEGLTLRAIARHAGVSHGAPLRHFPSLAALLAAVAADGFVRLVASITTALEDA